MTSVTAGTTREPRANSTSPAGTDWTRAANLLTFKQGVDAFRTTNRISDSDKVKLMGANTARLYGWSLPKS
jgi:hypothetical protein